MATRENQGLQIALILFVMITVALAISTYIYFRKSEEKIAEATAAQQAAQQANQQRDLKITEAQRLKEFMGWPIEAGVADIEAGYNSDMTQFGADYPADEPKNYRTLPVSLLQALRTSNTTAESLRAAEEALKVKIAALEKQHAADIAALEKLRDVAIADLASERTKFNDDRTKLAGEQEKLAAMIANKNKETTQIVATLSGEKEAIENLRIEEEQRANALRDKLAGLTKTTFETADGRITFVNQAAGLVTIDVGLLDGVRPQTAFKVYAPGQTSYEVENSKGTIEVVSITGKHRAEARIISDSTADPILRDDFIFTPLWRPGTNVRFALAGMIDLDEDGQSDRSLIRGLINMNSGIVDAEVDETGKRNGKMTVDTRYLVVGKRPTETTDPAAIAGYTNMLTDAQNLGIEQITVSKLLDYLNYRGTERSVKLGRGANPKDFTAQPIDGVNRSSTGDNAFKDRRPAPTTEKKDNN